jgi:cytochrome c5
MALRLPRRARALGLLVLLIAACAGRHVADAPPPAPAPLPIDLDGRPDPRADASFADVVRRECAQCHVLPSPSDLPRAQWAPRIAEMKRFSLTGVGLAAGRKSALDDLEALPFVRYFEERAPEELPVPPPWPPPGEGPVRFRRRLLSPPRAVPVPIVANTRFFDLDGDGRLEIVACDMGHGLVFLGEPTRHPGELREIAKIPNPVHAAMVDLDRDGRPDLLVADIGFFMPEDNEKGAVVWLRQTGPLTFEKHVLVERLPRTTDVEAADLDGDGDLDLVVTSFGLHSRGDIRVYENQTTDWAQPRFVGTTVDARAGAIAAPVADLDRDGRPDFVALLAQQHEQVVAFTNRGDGRLFDARTLFTAPTPAWGSTGIELVDLDGDGDLDVLLTNGDTLDDATIRPYHGVRWLENRGGFSFVRHDLGALPGAYRAQAADLDGDGDLDVAVAAFLPDLYHTRGGLASLGWLEQVRPGVFVPHTLQAGQLSHTTLDLGDFDGDGDVDIVTGNFVGFTFARTGTGIPADGWVELWENLGR